MKIIDWNGLHRVEELFMNRITTREKILRKYGRNLQGKTYVSLAKEFGVTRQTMRILLINMNLQRFGNKGFAGMKRSDVRRIARMGGQASQRLGTAHVFTSEEARLAGIKGSKKRWRANHLNERRVYGTERTKKLQSIRSRSV